MEDQDGGVLSIIAASISMAIVIFFIVPLVGVVTRYRINFTPKGVGLGDLDEGDGQRLSQDMRVGPVVNSIFAMFVRVRRIEGYVGLYKGLMPLVLTGLLQHLLSYMIISGGGTSPRYAISAGGTFTTIIWTLIITAWAIPREILVNRAITTPIRLSWFDARVALRVLFTPYERAQPWRLYLTPGIALAQILHILYLLLVVRGARAILVPSFKPGLYGLSGAFDSFWSFMGLSTYLFFLCLSFIVLCPLEVLSARLSVQRNHPLDADGVAVPASTGPSVEDTAGLEYAGAEEDVIGLRDEDQPYESLWSAARKIVDEEGWATLYRAFYLTLAGTVFSGLT